MKRFSVSLLTWLVLVFCSVLFYACGGGGGSGGTAPGPEAPGVGRVAILLTDAPTDAFDEVNVTITQVYLLADEKRSLLFESDPGETYNLLDLRDNSELLFAATEVPAGCYDKVRLVVTSVELVRYERDPAGEVVYRGAAGQVVDDPALGEPGIAEGFPTEAKLSSGKIDLNPRERFCVVGGETLVLQLDMDASRSIHVTANGKGYNFRPVVFVTVLDGQQGQLGKLVRLSGWMRSVEADRFTLCDTTRGPLLSMADAGSACTEVVAGDATSLFDIDGSPIVLLEGETLENVLFPDDFATVIGRYSLLATPARKTSDDDLLLRRFDAEVVEIGTGPETWRRYRGEVASIGPFENCEGTFDLLLDPGQGLTGELTRPVHLFAGSRLFDPEGVDLSCADLEVGRRVTVDAVLYLADGDPDVLKAAVVVVEPPVVEPEIRIEGTLVRVGDGGQVFVVRGDPPEELCAALRPGVIPLLYDPDAGELADIPLLDDSYAGLPITLFGDWQEGAECFSAGAVVVTGPVPVSPPPET